MVGAADLLAGGQGQLGALVEARPRRPRPRRSAASGPGRSPSRPTSRPAASAASRAIATFAACSSRVAVREVEPEDVGAGPDQLRHASRPSAWRGRSWRRSSCGGGRRRIERASVGSRPPSRRPSAGLRTAGARGPARRRGRRHLGLRPVGRRRLGRGLELLDVGEPPGAPASTSPTATESRQRNHCPAESSSRSKNSRTGAGREDQRVEGAEAGDHAPACSSGS